MMAYFVGALIRHQYSWSARVSLNFAYEKDSRPRVFLQLNFACAWEWREIHKERKVWFSCRKVGYSEKTLPASSLESFFMERVITVIQMS